MKRLMVLTVAACGLLAASQSARAQDWAKAKVDASPRHGEWDQVKYGNRTVATWVVYPQVSDKRPVVLLISEIYGLSPWLQEMADDVAAAGYIAVAPDLLSGTGANGGGTSSYNGNSEVIAAIGKLPADQINADLNAVADYALKFPSADGKLVVAGFCWGGGKSFLFATIRPDLKAAFVFYGTPPPAAAMAQIKAPVYGFYAGSDNRVSSTIPQATADMKAAGKPYDSVVYDGAGHGFMRAGEDPAATGPMAEANKKARDAAWDKWMKIMDGLK